MGFFLLGVFLRLVGFSILWWGAAAVNRRRNLFAARLARFAAVGLSIWILLGTIPWLIAATQRMGMIGYPKPREATSLVFIVCDGLVAGLGLIASFKTHKALRRPGISTAFR